MHCELRTPERVLFSGEATMVVARSLRGEFGVMNGHAPLLAVLTPSPLRIKTPDGEVAFALARGLLQVDGNEVVILAQEAVPKEEINLDSVRARIAEVSGSGQVKEELAFLHAQERVKGQ